MHEQGFYFGTEEKGPWQFNVIEWFDSISVSRQNELSLLTIPNGKSEHAIKPVERFRPPSGPGIEHYFRICLGTKLVSLHFQLCT